MFHFTMKIGVLGFVAMLAIGQTGIASAADGGTNGDKPRALIVYFSHTDTTRGIAERIQGKLDAAVYRVKPRQAYPDEYDAVLTQARQEIDEDFKPELQGLLPSLDGVDLILVGAPVWCGTLPPPLSSFLAQVDLQGKVVAPFCTYGGGLRDYFLHFKASVSREATVLDGLGFSREQLKMTGEEIDAAVAAWVAALSGSAVK